MNSSEERNIINNDTISSKLSSLPIKGQEKTHQILQEKDMKISTNIQPEGDQLIIQKEGNRMEKEVRTDEMNEPYKDLNVLHVDLSSRKTKGSNNDAVYKPRWQSSSNNDDSDDEEQGLKDKNEESSIKDSIDENFEFVSNDDLPSFADDECKRLNLEIQQLDRQRGDIEKKTKDHTERVEVMSNHLQQVRQEIDYTNGLVAAKKKETKSEDHLTSISEREKESFNKEILRTIEGINRERERFKQLQSNIFLEKREMDTFRLKMNWNHEELQEWASKASAKEEDNMALEKYTRADEAKIKELVLVIERLSKLQVGKNIMLQNEITNTQSRQLEVQRSVNIYKSQHEERQQIVNQWQDTIQHMKKRDHDLNQISIKYSKTKNDLENQLQRLAQAKERHEVAEVEKNEIQQSIDSIERNAQLKKQENLAIVEEQKSFENELEILRHENVSSSLSLVKIRNEHTMLETELKEGEKQLKQMEKLYKTTKQKLDKETLGKISQEQTVKDIEDLLVNHEKELKKVVSYIQTLNDLMFKDSQHLASLRKNELNLITDIKSAQKTAKNLTSKLQALKAERIHQHELIYNADFQKQQMERKVARGLGICSNEERIQLQSKISELDEEINLQKQKKKDLNQQYRKLEQELRIWSRKKGVCEDTQKDFQEKIKETELEISSCEISLQSLSTKRDNVMVAHDVMRLDMRRLRDLLKQKREEVLSLKAKKEHIAHMISEKKEDIKTLTEVRSAQFRVIEEERHKNAIELGQRRLVVQKLKSKFELLCKVHHPENDGCEENHSQVYYLVKAAQRKEELQREGDDLDHRIRIKEKELRAMKKTLIQLRERNTDYRLSFTKTDLNSEQAKLVVSLEKEIRTAQEALFSKKMELQQLENEVRENKNKVKKMNHNTDQLAIQNVHLQEAECQVQEEVSKRNLLMEEFSKKVKDLSTLHRKGLKISALTRSLHEQTICANLMEANAKSILQMLQELSHEFPEMSESIKNDIERAGLKVN